MPAVNVRDLRKLQTLLSAGSNRAIMGMLRCDGLQRTFPETAAKLIKRFSAFEDTAKPAKLRTFSAMHDDQPHQSDKSIGAANPQIAALLNSSVIARTYPTAAKELGKRFGATVAG